MSWEIKQGDALERLREMPDESVHCCVTSPPYWGLRDYGVSGQLGLEKTPELYVSRMTEVFREVRRVLRSDGTLWLNIGDSYAASATGSNTQAASTLQGGKGTQLEACKRPDKLAVGMKPKDLCGIPWLLAFALRSDGWYLRQDIIWSKPNPMPESVTDRCTKAHEYLFLLSKSSRYYYDAESILEPSVTEDTRKPYTSEGAWQLDGRPAEQRHGGEPRGQNGRGGKTSFRGQGAMRFQENGRANRNGRQMAEIGAGVTRNKRSVWEIATQPYSEAHFATFPPKLIEPCILAGCPEGGTVLDPFSGAGTTGLVATRLQRNFIGIELNPAYVEMAEKRITQDAPLFNSAESYGVGTQRPGSVKQNGSPKKRISKGSNERNSGNS